MSVSGTAWEGRNAAEWRDRLQVPAVHLYETIGSTNDVARELADAGAASLTTVIADHQTSGRGRGGRSWLSTPGSSLLCSIVFRGTENAAAPGAAPVRIGYAVARAIAQVAHVDTRVKWPNDVVIPGHGKIAGILCESVMRQSGNFVIGGIGVNVRAPGGEFASLNEISERDVGRGDLLEQILANIRMFATRLTATLTTDELTALRDLDILFGQEVEDDTGLAGMGNGIGTDGSLLVQTPTGLIPVHNATIRLAGSQQYPGART